MEANIIKLETGAGDMFARVAENARKIALQNKEATISFDFNGVECLVTCQTDLENLVRDYRNAHMMEWKTVGPECAWSYSSDILFELAKRTKEQEERNAIAQAKYEKAAKEKEQRLAAKISGVEFECADQPAYDSWKAKNTDGYGNAVFVFAEQWAKLMQVEIQSGKTISDCAKGLVSEADTVGLSGFQYGAACNILSTCWKHGEQFKEWRKSNPY